MKVSFFGTGYVGLCTAVCFAEKGTDTVGVDIDQDRVESISRGLPPFFEPGLDETLQKVLKNGSFRCTSNGREAVRDSEISFITVGTPSRSDGSIDLTYIKSASENLGEALRSKKGYHLIVVKSTVVPGITYDVVKPILESVSGRSCEKDFGLCFNPEFLREGSAMQDTRYPDRIVIGAHDEKSAGMLKALYEKVYSGDLPPLLMTNMPSAELIKYANNAFLAMKVSYANTIANICEKVPGADVGTVATGIGLDKRIGSLFLNAGLGYGGSCFPKDVKALISFSKHHGYSPRLLEEVEKVNEIQPYSATELAKRLIGSLNGARVAVLGLSFKPDTDDMREAVSIKIVNRLLAEGAKVVVHDPMAMKNARNALGEEVIYADNAYDCIKDADCCVIVTEWNEYKSLAPGDFVKHMKRAAVVDGRRIYDPTKFVGKVEYAAIGLGPPLSSQISRSVP